MNKQTIFNWLVILALLVGVVPGPALAQPSPVSPEQAPVAQSAASVALRLTPQAFAALPDLAPRWVVDYGSFIWLEVPAERLPLLRNSGLPYEVAGTSIGIYNFRFDPLQGEPDVPADLRADANSGAGLRLVQFVGPVNDSWLSDLKANGLRPLQYYAHNAYLVWGTRAQVESLAGKPYLRWSGDFHPAYKLNPSLDGFEGKIENVAVTFYNDGAVEATVKALKSYGDIIQYYAAQPDRAFYTAIVALDAAKLADVARMPAVWALDYASPRPGLDDENANQIVAGNFPGGTPAVGYYDWLDSKNINGYGVTWADVDTGLYADHPDITGDPALYPNGINGTRVVAYVTYPGAPAANTDTEGHGSHTAGAIMGDGRHGVHQIDPTASQDLSGFFWGTGMAPSATLVVQNALMGSDWPPAGGWNVLSRDSVLNGAVGSSNSWYTGQYDNAYTAACREHDFMVRDAVFTTTATAEPIIYVFSAGNGGPNLGTLSEPHASKNPIVVGASSNYPRSWASVDDMSDFSSRGPTQDNRYNPQIVAPGDWTTSMVGNNQASCYGQYPPGTAATYYHYCSGTSMSCPQVAGSSALIVDWWRQEFNGATPSPALVKALLVNGANDMVGGDNGGVGTLDNIPNFNTGWGRVNLNNTIRTGVPSVYFDQDTLFASTGETWQYTVAVADSSQPVKCSLAWTDAPGATGANPALVNDLNLVVVNGGNTYLGNVFTGGWSSTGGSADTLNNLENVFLPAGATGSVNVTVNAANIAGDGVPYNGDDTDQDFALVCYNVFQKGVGYLEGVTYDAAGDPSADPISGVTIHASGLAPTHTGSTTSGAGGYYWMGVLSDTYALEAYKYGYVPVELSGIQVISGTTTTQNISMTAANYYVVDGYVTDAATGDPLWATISLSGEPADPPTATVETDPSTGYYSVSLAESITYTFDVAAVLHDGASREVGPLTGDVTENFVLTATTLQGFAAGWVSNKYTGDPIEGATVQIAGGPSATTDDEGYYETPLVDAGLYTLTASANLYSSVTVTDVDVPQSNIAWVDFELPTARIELDRSTLEYTIELGQQFTETPGLVISNTGEGELTFELREQKGDFMPLDAGEDVLVVRHDTDAANAMQAALTANGLTFLGVTDAQFQAMTVEQLLEYKAVFHAGTTSTSTPNASETLLTAYLDAGGSVYISDNDLGYWTGSGTFYQTYLQADYISDDPEIDTLIGEDIMAGLTLDISADDYPDDFDVLAEGVRIFHFDGGSAAGVKVERGDYRAIYTSFDFDDIADVMHEQDVVARAMDFLAAGDAISWLAESPITGTVAAGGSAAIDVSWLADIPEVEQPGVYYASLKIKNNDPLNQDLTLPVTMTVTPPTGWGKLAGAVTSTGYCDVNPYPVEGAVVYVEGSLGYTYTLETDANGAYQRWLDSAENPYTLTVTYPEHPTTIVTVTVPGDGSTAAQDFVLRWQQPCVSVEPVSLSDVLDMGASSTWPVTITNDGAVALDFVMAEIDRGFQPALKGSGESRPSSLALTGVGNPALAETGLASGKPVLGKPANPDATLTWDPWETMAPLPSARVFNAVIASGNYVYVFGGTSDPDGTVSTDTTFRYNTATDTWDTMAPLPAAVMSIDGIEIGGKIYIPGDGTTADTYVYDIASNAWSTIAANGGYTAREQYQVVAIGTNLYVLGGIFSSSTTNQVWVLDTTMGTWSAGVPMQNVRTSFSAAAIGNNIYVAGGVNFDGSSFTPDMTAEKFEGGAWSYVAGVPNGGGAYTRWSYNADGHGVDGLWLAAGRRDADWNVLNHAGYYDPDTDTWTDSPTVPTLAQGRVYMEGDVAQDGYFYVIGGRDSAPTTVYATNERMWVGYPGGGTADAVPWLDQDPITGTVASDGGQVVADVTFDAGAVDQPGEYYATLVVDSNDPQHGLYNVPVTMTVNAPANWGKLAGMVEGLGYCDVATPTALADATVFIENSTGATWTLTTDGNGGYVHWYVAGVYTVSVSADGHVPQTAAASVTGGVTTTQDFALRWIGPCAQEPAPPALDEEVLLGGQETVQLTLGNLGAGDMTFEVRETTATLALLNEDVLVNVPAIEAQANAASRSKSFSRPARQFTMHVGWVSQQTIDVLLVTPDVVGGGDISLLQATLAAFPDLNVTLWDASVGTPTVADMQAHDVVFVGNDILWSSSAIDKTALSNNLADYIDAGGKVLAGGFVWSYDDWGLGGGRFITEDYSPYEMSTLDVWNAAVLGTYNTAHPIMAGITNVTDAFNHQDPTLSSNGTWVASWDDGENLVAVSPNCVGLNQVYFHSADFGGQVGELLHNSLLYLAGGGGGGPAEVPWLAEDPITGTVPADGVRTVDVTFTAFPTMTALPDYPVFHATLIIETDDPNADGGGTFYVPVTMTISAAPLCGFETNSPVNVGETVYFTNTTMGDQPMSYAWDLGDGASSTLVNPTHVYNASGLYTVTLVATNSIGIGSCSQVVEVNGPPNVGFVSNSPIYLGQMGHFTNTTTGYPDVQSWLWFFGAGATPNQSTVEAPPAIVFTTAGERVVQLTAVSPGGSGTYTDTFLVCSAPLTGADFSYTEALAGEVITFTAIITPNDVIPAPTVEWSLGGSGLQATHVFTPAGDYLVTITVTNDCDQVVYSATVTVTGETPPPAKNMIYLPAILKNM